MNDRFLDIINCKDYLREHIGVFKEAFVKYYGEECREQINELFDSSTLIAYISPKKKESIIYKAMNKKTKELCEKISNNIGVELTKEEIIGFSDFSATFLVPIKSVSNIYELICMTEEERKDKFLNEGYQSISRFYNKLSFEDYKRVVASGDISKELGVIPKVLEPIFEYYKDFSNIDKEFKNLFDNCKELLNKVNPNITIDNISDYKELLKSIDSIYKEALNEFNKYSARFEKYRIETEAETKRKVKLEKKYYIRLLEENMEFVPKSELEKVLKYINDEKELFVDSKIIKSLFGFSITIDPIIKSFGTEEDEKLNDDNVSKWIKDSIIDDRIKYFKLFGIDHGNDYDLYLNDENCLKIWPKKEKVDLFLEKRNNILNDYNIELYENSVDFLKIKEELDSLGLLDKEISFNAQLFTQTINTKVNPNLVREGDNYRLHNLIIINLDNYDCGYIDHFIVHELNHLFELRLTEANEEYYEYISGWDSSRSELKKEMKKQDTLNEDNTKRSYELLNEIVNELIAQEISKGMVETNSCVFDEEDNIQYKNVTFYEHMLFLVEDFFNEYKDIILKSRKSGNLQLIWDEVGKENFDELNELFNIFYDNFSGERIIRLRQSLKNNEENKYTKIYNELEIRKDEILENMRNYRKNNSINNVEEIQR